MAFLCAVEKLLTHSPSGTKGMYFEEFRHLQMILSE